MGIKDDVRDMFSDQQVVTGTEVSTNSKKKPAAQDLGIGCKRMGLVVRVDSAAAGGGTLLAELIQADDDALTTDVEALAGMTIPAESLIEGKSFFVELPGYLMNKEYFGARFTPAGGMTTVTLSAYFGAHQDVANFKSFPSTYNVQN